MAETRSRQVQSRGKDETRRAEQREDETRIAEQRESAERRAEKRAEAQRRRAETRRKGAEAQSLNPAEFRAKERIKKH